MLGAPRRFPFGLQEGREDQMFETLERNRAVLAGLGAEVADETSVSPTDPIEILDLGIDEGAQAVQRWQRVIAIPRLIGEGIWNADNAWSESY
jgi:hypothetical protein